MPAESTRRAWWQNPVFRSMEAEIAELRRENAHLRALLAPQRVPFPARWGLTPQQAAFLSLLALQAGCVPHQRLASALARGKDPLSRQQLQVIACHARRKTAPHGVEIEAYRGAGYGLTLDGRAAVGRAVEALARLRRA